MASGSYNYLHGLMLMVGVLFLRLTVETRLRALLFMALAGAFYLIGNARGLAVLPATLFVVGLIFLERHPPALQDLGRSSPPAPACRWRW